MTGEHAEIAHILRTEKPHLVLLDLMLPGADGIELMRNVSGPPENARLDYQPPLQNERCKGNDAKRHLCGRLREVRTNPGLALSRAPPMARRG